MNKSVIAVVAVVIIGAGLYFVATRNNSTATPNVPATASESSTTVTIQNYAFSPAVLTVKTGTTVTWVNDDNVAHTITSDSGTLLHSGTVLPGQSFSFTFSVPGPVSYHCNIHPSMKGTVSVEN